MSEALGNNGEYASEEEPVVFNSRQFFATLYYRDFAERIRLAIPDTGASDIERKFLELFDLAGVISAEKKIPESLTELKAMELYLNTLKIGDMDLTSYARSVIGKFDYTVEQLDKIEDLFIENNEINAASAINSIKGP